MESAARAEAYEKLLGSYHFYFDCPLMGEFECVYYNPNSILGGQIVTVHIPYSLVLEAAHFVRSAEAFRGRHHSKEYQKFEVSEFFNYISNAAYIESADRGDDDYELTLARCARKRGEAFISTESCSRGKVMRNLIRRAKIGIEE